MNEFFKALFWLAVYSAMILGGLVIYFMEMAK